MTKARLDARMPVVAIRVHRAHITSDHAMRIEPVLENVGTFSADVLIDHPEGWSVQSASKYDERTTYLTVIPVAANTRPVT